MGHPAPRPSPGSPRCLDDGGARDPELRTFGGAAERTLRAESMRTRCLCQICTCGRHRCPQGTTRIYEHSGVYCPTTEYLEKYPTYGSVLPAQSLKPKQEFRGYRAKMEGITTFK
ncbi:stabilizer of axonemal microtubules 1-like [Pteropus alecto]|uniref:stabilizer of axonemal microtubules 1-like n=1 Tax=Pteropus alecto TaxID=9402 RepID=UPI000D5370A9|nr:stabilizer of axonemal microtubules 1-like [Pteropus alecto]